MSDPAPNVPRSVPNTTGSIRAAPAHPPPQPKRKWGCGCWLLSGCLLTLFACAALGLGGYAVYASGIVTENDILNWVGLGPGDVEVDNFRDETVQVTFLQLDVPPDTTPLQSTLEIKPFDVSTYRIGQPGRYRVDFGTTYGGAELGSCTLTVKSGDHYQFVPLPDKIVVYLLDHDPSIGTDLIVETSPLCR